MLKKLVRSTALTLALAATAIAPNTARASGVPVFDASTFGQAVKQIIEMGKQLLEMEKQTGKLEDIIADLTGPRNMSGLLNSATEQATRRYADTDLSGFVDLASGAGGLSTNADDLATAAQGIISTYGLRPGAEMIPSAPTGTRAKSIDLAQGTTLAAMTVGESAFNGSSGRLAKIEGLIGAIDGTPDLKASVDLNTRMQAQVALLLNEMLTVQALHLRSTGVAMGLEAVTEDNVVSTFGFDATQYGAISAPTSP
jgi:type IV secretion system protein VirB5